MRRLSVLGAWLAPVLALAVTCVALYNAEVSSSSASHAIDHYYDPRIEPLSVWGAGKPANAPVLYLSISGGMTPQEASLALGDSRLTVKVQAKGQSATWSGLRNPASHAVAALEAPWVQNGMELRLDVSDGDGHQLAMGSATLTDPKLVFSETAFLGPGDHPEELEIFVMAIGGALGRGAPSAILVRVNDPKAAGVLEKAQYEATLGEGGVIAPSPLPCTVAPGSNRGYALFTTNPKVGSHKLMAALAVTVTTSDGRRASYQGELPESLFPQIAVPVVLAAQQGISLHVPSATDDNAPIGFEVRSEEGRVFAAGFNASDTQISLPALGLGRYWANTSWQQASNLGTPQVFAQPFVVEEPGSTALTCDKLSAHLRRSPYDPASSTFASTTFPTQLLLTGPLRREPENDSSTQYRLGALLALAAGASALTLWVRARPPGGTKDLANPVSIGLALLAWGFSLLLFSALPEMKSGSGDYNPLSGLTGVLQFFVGVVALLPTVFGLRMAVKVRRKLY